MSALVNGWVIKHQSTMAYVLADDAQQCTMLLML